MRPPRRWSQRPTIYSLILRQTFRLQAAIILLGLALPPLAVVPLHLQQRIIDVAIPEGDAALVLWLGALYLGAQALRAALKFAVIYLRGWISAIIARVLRAALLDAQRKRQPAQARSSLGAVTSVLTGEVRPLGDFAAEAINTPLIQGGTLLGVFGYMMATDWRLALIGLASLGIEGVVTPILQNRINRLTGRRIRSLRTAAADVIVSASGQRRASPLVHGLRQVRKVYGILLRMNALKAALKVLRNLIDHTADIAIIAVGASLVMQGEIGIGVIVAFLSGLREVRGPWGELVSFYRRLADATVKYRLVRGAVRSGNGHDVDRALAPRPAADPAARLRDEAARLDER